MSSRRTHASGNHLFVVSGCSSSGKSTLVAALAMRGEIVVLEPGRQIVNDELSRGGDGLPWENKQRFIDRCAEQAIQDYDRQAAAPRRAFFDRGFIDVASAVTLTGLESPPRLTEALRSRRYAPIAFLAAPWKDLFRNDAERRHSFEEAVAEYEMLVPTYRGLGYEIWMLPQVSVEERVAFVLEHPMVASAAP